MCTLINNTIIIFCIVYVFYKENRSILRSNIDILNIDNSSDVKDFFKR